MISMTENNFYESRASRFYCLKSLVFPGGAVTMALLSRHTVLTITEPVTSAT